MDNHLSPERAAWLRLQKRSRSGIRAVQLLILPVFLLIWEFAADQNWIDAFLVSSPSRMWHTIVNLYRDGDLFLHLGVSCLETMIGFIAGTVLGSLIAIILWLIPKFFRIIDPYLVVLNSLPKTALGPVFIVWIGAGPSSIIAMTLAISLIVTVLEVHNGFLGTDSGKLRLLQSMGASKLQILWKLVLPANLPTIVNALKVNVSLSWVGVIMGEFLVSRAGLGYLIVYGSQVFKMDLVMATVLLLALAAAGMYQGILFLEKIFKKHLGVSI